LCFVSQLLNLMEIQSVYQLHSRAARGSLGQLLANSIVLAAVTTVCEWLLGYYNPLAFRTSAKLLDQAAWHLVSLILASSGE
jgi:ABC-type spermidine/putrescine transport system permease subunit I